MVGVMSRATLFALLYMWSGMTSAENLPDPTRPPAILETTGVAHERPSSGLQSVFISVNRRAAIIDGEMVELGKKHGDAKLIAVNEGNVVLQGAQGRQVLSLFPGVKISRDDTVPDASLAEPEKTSIKPKKKPIARKEKK